MFNKKISKSIFVLVQFFSTAGFSGSISTAETAQDSILQIGTYNIRYAAPEDELTGNGWNKRKAHLIDVIKNHHLDIVGTQEGDDKQLRDMQLELTEYSYIREGYGSASGSHNAAVFYKNRLFQVLDQGHFWMSETPEQKSKGWDASDYRITQWVKFQERLSGKVFFVFNTHFYWRKHLAKDHSGVLLANWISKITGQVATICMGDFNSLPGSKPIKAMERMLVDSYKSSVVKENQVVGTGFAGGVFSGISDDRIDYIFTTNDIQVHSYQAVDTTYEDNRYPSDHLPVVVSLSLP